MDKLLAHFKTQTALDTFIYPMKKFYFYKEFNHKHIKISDDN